MSTVCWLVPEWTANSVHSLILADDFFLFIMTNIYDENKIEILKHSIQLIAFDYLAISLEDSLYQWVWEVYSPQQKQSLNCSVKRRIVIH